MTSAAELDLSELDRDKRLFLYTSLTAGSSHIVTATSRMETILKANRIPFIAVDLATDAKCRRLWQRRGGAKKKLPGLVKEGYIIGDLEEVEEWNEFGELKENIGPVPASTAAPAGAHAGISTAPPLAHNVPGSDKAPQAPQAGFDKTKAVALPGAEEMAAIHKAKAAEKLVFSDKARAAEKEKEVAPMPSTEEGSTEKEASADPASSPQADKPAAAEAIDTSKESESSGLEEPSKVSEKVESESSVEKEEDAPVKAVEGLSVDEPEAPSEEVTETKPDTAEGEKTQDQDAKEPEAAGKSVED